MSSTRIVLPSAPAQRWQLIPSERGPFRTLAIAFLAIVLLLVALGVMMVQSAGQVVAIAAGNPPLDGLLRQGSFALLGLALLFGVSRFPTRALRRLSWVLLLIGFALQALVYSPLGYEAGGNRNWLRLGPISLQPAEFMKFVLLIWVSSVIATKRPLMDRWVHVFIPILPIAALSMFINVLGGDLGTLMVIIALLFGCLYFSQIRARILAAIAGIAVLGVAVMTLIKPNRVFRILHFLEVDCIADAEHAAGMCWQSLNGFWALANGGVTGTGLGGSTAKWSWLPEAETDFIFAIVGEELGLIGAIAVVLLFVALGVVLVALVSRARDPFTISVCGGAAAWITAQMAVNVAVVLGFVPVLGVPLPFVSAGGTSLLSLLLMAGVVLACVREEAQRASGVDPSPVAAAPQPRVTHA